MSLVLVGGDLVLGHVIRGSTGVKVPQASCVCLRQESSFSVTFSFLSSSLGKMLSLADTWNGDSVV